MTPRSKVPPRNGPKPDRRPAPLPGADRSLATSRPKDPEIAGAAAAPSNACGFIVPGHRAFQGRKTCDECPWRKDVPVGRFPPERFIKLRSTVEQGFGPLFACHKTRPGGDVVCVGYLLRDGENNFVVRLAASRKHFNPEELEATGPLYDSFEQMARANGVRRRSARR